MTKRDFWVSDEQLGRAKDLVDSDRCVDPPTPGQWILPHLCLNVRYARALDEYSNALVDRMGKVIEECIHTQVKLHLLMNRQQILGFVSRVRRMELVRNIQEELLLLISFVNHNNQKLREFLHSVLTQRIRAGNDDLWNLSMDAENNTEAGKWLILDGESISDDIDVDVAYPQIYLQRGLVFGKLFRKIGKCFRRSMASIQKCNSRLMDRMESAGLQSRVTNDRLQNFLRWMLNQLENEMRILVDGIVTTKVFVDVFEFDNNINLTDSLLLARVE